MIPLSHSLAPIHGAYNAVLLEGERLGQSLLYGLGAGGAPTATAVVADIVEIARNIAYQVPGVPPLGYRIEDIHCNIRFGCYRQATNHNLWGFGEDAPMMAVSSSCCSL